MKVVNNQETHEGDSVFYVDHDGQIHDAVINSIAEQDGNHFAELKVNKSGKHSTVTWVPHNTSREKHSWNHPMRKEEVELHNDPNYYGGE